MYTPNPYTSDDEFVITHLEAVNENFARLRHMVVPPDYLFSGAEINQLGYDTVSKLFKRYTLTDGWVNAECSEYIGRAAYSENFSSLISNLGGLDALKAALGIGVAFDSGTRAIFVQDTAPTGWTIDSAYADCLIAIKGGSQAYNVAGGSRVGTWQQAPHSHGTGDVTLTAAQSGHPAVNINVKRTATRDEMYGGGVYQGHILTAGDGEGVANSYGIPAMNAAAAHNHGNTTSTTAPDAWRPYAAVSIVCTLD